MVESSTEAFILRIFRQVWYSILPSCVHDQISSPPHTRTEQPSELHLVQGNKTGFIKAFTDAATSFNQGAAKALSCEMLAASMIVHLGRWTGLWRIFL